MEILDAFWKLRWYLLTEKQKKTFQFILHRAQNFVQINVVLYGPVGAETFVNVGKNHTDYW
jgi:hypothetical protein